MQRNTSYLCNLLLVEGECNEGRESKWFELTTNCESVERLCLIHEGKRVIGDARDSHKARQEKDSLPIGTTSAPTRESAHTLEAFTKAFYHQHKRQRSELSLM